MRPPHYYTVALVKRKGSPMTASSIQKTLYVLIGLWALYNVVVATTCTGSVSPFYWPPVTQCTGEAP